MLGKISNKIEEIQTKFYKKIKSIKLVAINGVQRFFKKVTRPKFILVVQVTIVTIFLLSFGGYKFVTNPNTCSKCHEMRPEFATWANSQHSKFTCVDCHYRNKSFLTFTKDFNIDMGVKIYKHFTGNYISPIEVQKDSKNEICMNCHSANRITTPSGDIEFDHPKHVKKGYLCVQCHEGSVHGSIAEKGFTTSTDYNKWTVALGKAYMKPKYTMTSMQTCMECHKDNGIKTTCADCHNTLGNPKSHRDKAWKTKHGAEARKNIDSCDRCHAYSMSVKPQTYSDDPVANYARNNKYCSACHLGVEGQNTEDIYFNEGSSTTKKPSTGNLQLPGGKPPDGHTRNWRKTHQYQAKADTKGCLVCHEESRSSGKNATRTYCTKCHRSHPMPEEASSHPVNIKGQGFSNSCLKCHPQKSCGQCHYIN